MLAEERFAQILDLLSEKRSATVQELCEALNASESTIRRDLTELDRLGTLNKVHGGATLPDSQFLADEPTSALDPISTLKIEELAEELKKKYTIIIVTHNMQQAVRISDRTAFFLLGELVEYGDTEKMFSDPVDKRTEDYITGRFG